MSQCVNTVLGEQLCSFPNGTCGATLPGNTITNPGVCNANDICTTPSLYGGDFYCSSLNYVQQPLYNPYSQPFTGVQQPFALAPQPPYVPRVYSQTTSF